MQLRKLLRTWQNESATQYELNISQWTLSSVVSLLIFLFAFAVMPT
jgi:hypothetical protein